MILLTAIAIAYFIQQHIFIDFKPFNCWACLSFWVAVILYICEDINHVHYSFGAYLLTYLIMTYERK
jgi:hypothetical protein